MEAPFLMKHEVLLGFCNQVFEYTIKDRSPFVKISQIPTAFKKKKNVNTSSSPIE